MFGGLNTDTVCDVDKRTCVVLFRTYSSHIHVGKQNHEATLGRDMGPDEALSSRHPICRFEPVYITDTPLTFNKTPHPGPTTSAETKAAAAITITPFNATHTGSEIKSQPTPRLILL